MTGDCHVRFCEGLRLKCWGLLSYSHALATAAHFVLGEARSTAVYLTYIRAE
jgi:hypothetical protein